MKQKVNNPIYRLPNWTWTSNQEVKLKIENCSPKVNFENFCLLIVYHGWRQIYIGNICCMCGFFFANGEANKEFFLLTSWQLYIIKFIHCYITHHRISPPWLKKKCYFVLTFRYFTLPNWTEVVVNTKTPRFRYSSVVQCPLLQ